MPILLPFALVGVGVLALAAAGGGAVKVTDYTKKSPTSKRHGTRKWADITGITLHQTGTSSMGSSAVPKVTAHLLVQQDGKVYLLHPLDAYLWHGDTLNKDTVGIEVVGNFRSDPNDEDSWWRPGGGPTTLGSKQRAGLQKAISYAVGKVKEKGGKITHVYAHRQGAEDRGIDPGAEIWKHGAIWARSRYRLDSGPRGYTRGSGKPIPPYWDPAEGVALPGARSLDIRSDIDMWQAEGEDERPG